jgi:F-type H+-transporting ATPase subunit c
MLLTTPVFLHYATLAFIVGLTSIGVGIGQGIATTGALQALNIQPLARPDIIRCLVLGLALIETAAIIGITIVFMLFFSITPSTLSLHGSIAELGILCAMSFSGFTLGMVSAFPVRDSCLSLARQPFFSQKIMRFMLIVLSIIQSPIIFSFIIAISIKDQIMATAGLSDALRLLGAGLSIGLGCIGPAIGIALFAKTACKCIGLNRTVYNTLVTFTLISEAMIETPIIFSMVIALMLIGYPAPTLLRGCALLGAGLCIGIGTMSTGISSGRVASVACENIVAAPEKYALISRASLFAQGIMETIAIYALLVALALISLT